MVQHPCSSLFHILFALSPSILQSLTFRHVQCSKNKFIIRKIQLSFQRYFIRKEIEYHRSEKTGFCPRFPSDQNSLLHSRTDPRIQVPTFDYTSKLSTLTSRQGKSELRIFPTPTSDSSNRNRVRRKRRRKPPKRQRCDSREPIRLRRTEQIKALTTT